MPSLLRLSATRVSGRVALERRFDESSGFSPDVTAVVEGIGLAAPSGTANRRSENAVSKITRRSTNKSGLEVPIERPSALSMQWIVSLDANGSRCLRAQWEGERALGC